MVKKFSRTHQRINARHANAKWRSEPATEQQWKVLRRIGSETGQVFDIAITRGEASEIIGGRFATDDSAARWHRRSQARRRRSA